MIDEIKENRTIRALIVLGIIFLFMSGLMLIGIRQQIYSIYFLVLGFGILITTFLYMMVSIMVNN